MAVYGSTFKCSECGNTSYETGQIRVSGGFWSSFFDVGNRRYNAVSCNACGYTKFYKNQSQDFKRYSTLWAADQHSRTKLDYKPLTLIGQQAME